MEIEHIAYIKENSTGDGNQHSMLTTYWLGRILPFLRNKKIEHLRWVGVVENLFTEEPTPYALIFYNGSWDPKYIVDRLILDITDPYSDAEEYPSPFQSKLEFLNFDRKKFIEHLKGEYIY